MAISTNVYVAPQFRVAIAEESSFGTAITTQSSFKELEITNTPWPDYSGIVREVRKRADGKRVLSHTDIYVDEEGGADGYTVITEGILTDLTADLLLYGVMQDLVSEDATTPYLKEFAWRGATDGDNSGVPYKFYTVNGYNPASGESWALTSCVIKTLTITSDPGTNGGKASFSATFWTGFKPAFNQTVTPASWTAPGTDWYVHQLLNTKAIGGTTDNLVLGSFSVTFENNVKRVGFDSSGDPQMYVFPQFDITGELKAKYDANTKDEIDNFVLNPEGGSAERQIYLRWGDGTADGTLLFDINAVYTGIPTPDFGNDAGVMITLPIQGVDDGTNEAIDVKIANAVDRAW
jgi:hypothetical protein